jgi:hypothetical protein
VTVKNRPSTIGRDWQLCGDEYGKMDFGNCHYACDWLNKVDMGVWGEMIMKPTVESDKFSKPTVKLNAN